MDRNRQRTHLPKIIEMEHPLIKRQRQALRAMNEKNFRVAIPLFEEILKESPSWEHGRGFYNLAGCYEDIGELNRAEENYLNALRVQPMYHVFIGGYASFLYLFGEPAKAFEWYLKYLKSISEFRGVGGTPTPDLERMGQSKSILFDLGKRLGWNRNEVEKRISDFLIGK